MKIFLRNDATSTPQTPQLTCVHLKTHALSLLCICITIAALIFGPLEPASSQIETPAKNSQNPVATDGEAKQLFSRAETLYATWTEASLREAIAHYDQAAQLWTSGSEFANASVAALKSGGVYILFGEYQQALERYQNAEALAKKAGDRLAQARALSYVGLMQWYLRNKNAASLITKAIQLFEQNNADQNTVGYGEALSNLAEFTYAQGELSKASTQFDKALEFLEHDRKEQARVHRFKGYIAGSRGYLEEARTELELALALYRESDDKSGEALALTAMGLRYSSLRDENRAIETNTQARDIFQRIGLRHSQGFALNAIAQAYENLHQYDLALENYEKALQIFGSIKDSYGASASTYGIATVHYLRGQLNESLTKYQQCLDLSRAARNRRIESFAVIAMAKIYSEQGRHELALREYQNLQKFSKDSKDLREEATALNGQGISLLEIGKTQKALNLIGQALSLTGQMNDKGIEIETLFNLARVNDALERYDDALSNVERSFTLIEEIRRNVGSPDFRASYFSAGKKHHDLWIAILMKLEKLRPGNEHAANALLASEKGRARLLIDLLTESFKSSPGGAAKEDLERERNLKAELQLMALYRMTLPSNKEEKAAEIADVESRIAQLKSEYQAVLAKLNEQNPRLFAFEQFAPASLKDIQKELDDNTMLLEFALGEDHSYLWAVTTNSFHSYELPDGKTIEAAARELYEVFTVRQTSTDVATTEALYSEKASQLGSMLLGPVAERLRTQRLLIVTDGALQYIPFEALLLSLPQANHSTDASRELIATNEVVVLPSVSTLVAIRRAQKAKSAATGKLVAIVADPVFTANDDRVPKKSLPPVTTETQTDQPGKLKLPRLAYASEEADAISAVAPYGTTLVAKGFDANRETVLSDAVSRAQIVHFATHGVLDSKHPEFSNIVLAMIDHNGSETNGVMPLPDIYGLQLSAELTVLSACETALGKDVKGEGLIGLTHSFFAAGANTVVASLWKVDDRATAILMGEFYENMLQKGMTPAAALRAAKLKMMQDKQWSAPYYWAGFVLQGEYTNQIVVNRPTWLRPLLVASILLVLITITLVIIQRRKRRIPPGQFSKTE